MGPSKTDLTLFSVSLATVHVPNRLQVKIKWTLLKQDAPEKDVFVIRLSGFEGEGIAIEYKTNKQVPQAENDN